MRCCTIPAEDREIHPSSQLATPGRSSVCSRALNLGLFSNAVLCYETRLVIELAMEEVAAAPHHAGDRIVGLGNAHSCPVLCARATVLLLLMDPVRETTVDAGLRTRMWMRVPTSTTVPSQSFPHPLLKSGYSSSQALTVI